MLDTAATKILAAIAALGLLVAAFLFGFGLGRSTPSASPRLDYRLLTEAETKVRAASVKEVDRRILIQGALRGMLEALDDPYAEYLDPETYRSFRDLTQGHFTGVGLLLKMEDERVKVVSVLEDSPASDAGMLPGDFIVTVDGRDVGGLSLEQVAQRIKGDAGTNVRVTVDRSERTYDFQLVRADITVESVSSRLLRRGVGLVELVTFSQDAGEKVREAVKSLVDKGAKALILDLRGNPGGLVDEAVEVSSVFLDGGSVVSYKERGKAEVVYSTRGSVETRLPLVVLVDEGSASASEIVAGAIQDRGRGIIVGQETYGKGSIQTVFPLSDGSAVKVTTASYFTPSGRSIGDKGITPDVAVLDKLQQLARAQEILQEMLAENPAKQAG